MKLAYLTPLSVETIVAARRLGYDALEVGAGWGERSRIAELEASLPALRDALAEHKIGITSVAIYGETIQRHLDDALDTFERAMELCHALGCSVVSALTGRDSSRTFDENLPVFEQYFGPIAQLAEDRDVKIAFEPWPGPIQGHGPYDWRNMATTPELWDKLFSAVPSAALGLEYDPSHLVWQGIDHIQVIRDYAERIHHVHAKDIIIDEAKLRRVGVHGRGWWRFAIPGLGQIDWSEVFDALAEAGYGGDMAVEHKDRTYLDERWNEGLMLGLKTLRPFVEAYQPKE